MPTLFTKGYSGHDLDSFFGNLQEHKIQVVVDVRRNPVSRKRGFSRAALSQFLEAKGVKYVHEKDLGVPQPLRHQLRDGECDLQNYLDDFRTYLGSHSTALERVYNLASKERCCLLCVEECSQECHRSVVADELAALNGRRVKVVHI